MNRDQKIYEKINQSIRLLCDVYDLLNEKVESNKNSSDENLLLSIKDFIKKHSSFTEGAIRYYIHQNVNNFKEKVIRKVAKRIYINEKLFFEWVNENDR